MSTKFEQLLDYLINEEQEKANELFHEIVVEKSRSIYENLIAEEEDEDMDEAKEEDMDESADEDMDEAKEEDMDESADEDMDESADEDIDEGMEELEDSYQMGDESAEDDGFSGGAEGDSSDEFGKEIGTGEPDPASEEGEDKAIYDIKDAIEQLEAAFAELEHAQNAEMGRDDDFGHDDEEGETDEDMMGMPTMENRRVTREYVEKVGNDWDKNSQKTQGQIVGKNTGEAMPTATEPATFKWGNGKPTSTASAKNLDQSATEGQHNTGTTPNKVNKGITPEKGEQYTGKDWETNSAPGGKAGVKNLKKVGDAKGLAGATKNNGSEGTAAGAGTGDNSVKGATYTKAVVDKKF